MKEIIKQLYWFILPLCLLFSLGTAAHAQSQDSVPAASQPIQVRLPDQKKLETLRADKDFQYYEQVQTGSTFWERLWYRVKNWLREVFYKGKASGIWEYVIYALIIGAIVFIVVKMHNVDAGGLFGKKAVSSGTPYDVFEENIHELDLQALIEEAVVQRDFRKAIRLHYLQSLKQLTDAGLIDWKPGKTNRSYINEIHQPDTRKEFELLTSMFEYVWYGGAALGEAHFTTARAEFHQFNQHVKQRA
ncbi:DUF4129 domain-containing protein [Pontibacter rugosus]|uniref:DUF4129 domain-containing protein n=1 Tax=Pontibacter rugosus TaxID=1745966 RepID=A0ABW3SQ64_9BACT